MERERVHDAIDLKDAACRALEHVAAPDRSALASLDASLDEALSSPRPDHARIDKLLTMRGDLRHYTHMDGLEDCRASLDAAMA